MPNPHNKPVFTRHQLQSALAADRVFTFDGVLEAEETYNGAHIVDFPYVIFAEGVNPQNLVCADGWRVNFKGEIFPGHVVPVPIVLREVSHIDFAAPDLRQPLIAHIKADEHGFAGFANEETMRVAQVLTSDAATWEYLHSTDAISETSWRAHVKRALREFVGRNRSKFGPGYIALHAVDWEQIADEFELTETSGRKPSSVAKIASQPPEIAVLETSNAVSDDEQAELPSRIIDGDVLDVLKESRADGEFVYLPKQQLDRTLYSRINAVLNALGGKWVGGSRRGHRFDCDAEEILYAITTTGRFTHPSDLGFFPTPVALINRLLAKAKLRHGSRVIEPQAGQGGLACAAAAAVGGTHLVTVCELMERNVRKLRDAGFASVHHCDFLRMPPVRSFQSTVCNPPFSGGQDIEHVLHASRFIVPGGTVTTYMSRTWLYAKNKKSIAFRDFLERVKADVEEVEAGAFRSSGTNVATTLVHFHV